METNRYTYQACPLYQQYLKTRKAFFREMREENWRREQRRTLYFLIELTFREIDEPKADYWKRILYRNYCRRFYGQTQEEWIDRLATFTNEQAYGQYLTDKAKIYCVAIRNKAYEIKKERQNVLYFQSDKKETTMRCGKSKRTTGSRRDSVRLGGRAS